MKRCNDCKWGNRKVIWNNSERSDYCGKKRNRGGPCDYDYWLPKKTFNKDGDCKDFKLARKWWEFW